MLLYDYIGGGVVVRESGYRSNFQPRQKTVDVYGMNAEKSKDGKKTTLQKLIG